MALPNNGGTITPDEQIQFQPTNYWTFPSGSVFVKSFDLVVNTTNATVPFALSSKPSSSCGTSPARPTG